MGIDVTTLTTAATSIAPSSERAFGFIRMNDRTRKPRHTGITEIRGPYYAPMGPRYLEDVLETMGAYVDALQDTRRCFPDPELAGCLIRTDRFGLPRPISGNFASVFTADTASGRRLAVKCFTRDVPDQQARFREIEAALRAVPARWKVVMRAQWSRGRLALARLPSRLRQRRRAPAAVDRVGPPRPSAPRRKRRR